jgi:hypothetical protein
MDQEPAPFRCGPSITVEGGYLKKAWPCQATVIGGAHFIALKKTDRDLGKALGYLGRSPLAGINVFDYIANLRNKKVDQLIHEKCSDPLADIDGFKAEGKERIKLFSQAEIPNVVSVDLAASTAASGKRIPWIVCKVVATLYRHTTVTVEASPYMLDWLVQACPIDWSVEVPQAFEPRPEPIKRALPENLPELEHPLSYLRKGPLAVAVAYKDEQGVHRKRQRKIEHLVGQDPETNSQLISIVSNSLLDFYHQHHCGGVPDDAKPEDSHEAEGGK